jgi:hypothetical protein
MLGSRNGINDFGPIYAETDPSGFPVEPFNTFSNLIFLLIVIHLWRLTRLNFKSFPLSSSALPILLIGFIGGTVFHATRSHSIWLILDFIPIAVLVLLACIYFWRRLTGGIMIAILLAPLPIFVSRVIISFLDLPRHYIISLSYAGMALSILIPALLYVTRQRQSLMRLLILSFSCFFIAITFRFLDSDPFLLQFLPMGSHFLWHLFGGVSSWLMIYLIFTDERACLGSAPSI